jgi:hypothetical protein
MDHADTRNVTADQGAVDSIWIAAVRLKVSEVVHEAGGEIEQSRPGKYAECREVGQTRVGP